MAWRRHTSLTTVINCHISVVDHCVCALAPMTSECCLCHAHTTDSETEASRPPVPGCGTIYHPNCDGQTGRFLFSSRNWKRTCLDSVLAETAARSHFLLFHALYKYSTYVCIYVCTYIWHAVSYELNLFKKVKVTWWKMFLFRLLMYIMTWYILVVFLRSLCVKLVDATSIEGFLVLAAVNFTDVTSNGAKQRSYHISSLCQLTTLIINKFLSLSLPAQNLPLSQTIPAI